jgi:hypothetical protein
MDLDKMVVSFSGPGQGISSATHYAEAGAGHQPDFKTFWTSMAQYMAGQVTITVPNSGDVIDSATGDLTGTWTGGTSATLIGGGSGAYPGGVGACINWSTSSIVNARKVRGRTFIVPMAAGGYDATGTLLDTAVNTYRTAAALLVSSTAGDFHIWHRPTTVGGSDGQACPVIGYSLRDHVAWLSSRRPL